MVKITNSGKKLYDIIKQAWDQEPQKTVMSVWAEVLGASPKSFVDVSEKFGQLIVLINDVRTDLMSLENINTEIYLSALNKIQAAILSSSMPAGEAWNTIKNQITEELLNLVAACSDLMLSQSKGINEIDVKELESLRQEIKDLINEIISSNTEKSTKTFLVEKLREIEQAIINYQIRGATGIKKANEQAVGGVTLFSLSKDISDKGKEKIIKFIEFSSKLNGSLGLVDKIYPLLENFKNLPFLPPGSN